MKISAKETDDYTTGEETLSAEATYVKQMVKGIKDSST